MEWFRKGYFAKPLTFLSGTNGGTGIASATQSRGRQGVERVRPLTPPVGGGWHPKRLLLFYEF